MCAVLCDIVLGGWVSCCVDVATMDCVAVYDLPCYPGLSVALSSSFSAAVLNQKRHSLKMLCFPHHLLR